MKKRIVSLILVTAMMLLALCSCAFNYEKADLSFDEAAFAASLKDIELTGLDFIPDNRDALTLESVNAKFADKATEKATVYGGNQKIVYNYFLIVDGKYSITYMAENKAATLCTWDVEDGTIAKAVVDKIAEMEPGTEVELAENLYEATVPADATAYVQYTKNGEPEIKVVTIPSGADDTFEGQLLGKDVGSELPDPIVVNREGQDADTYEKITVLFTNKGDLPFLQINNYTFSEAASVTVAGGETVPVSTDKPVTVNVIPVEVYNVPVLDSVTASNEAAFTVILEEILGENVTTSSLDVLANVEKTVGEGENQKTISSIVANIVALKADSAKTEELGKAVDTLAEDILAFNAPDFDVVALVCNQYVESVKNEMLKEYKDDIVEALQKKVLAAIEAITVTEVDKKAVKEATDRLYESYKYAYYTDDEITGTKSKKGLKAYIQTEYGVTDYESAKEAMEAEAKEEVEFLTKIYAVAQSLDLAKVGTDQMQVNNFSGISGNKSTMDYFKQLEQNAQKAYGDTNVKAKVVFDRVMDYYMTVTGETATDNAAELAFDHITYIVK